MPNPTDDLRAKLERAISAQEWLEGKGDPPFEFPIMPLLKESLSTLLDQAARVEALEGALAWFVRRGKSLEMDVASCHSTRGNGASDWMREADRDFRNDLAKALAGAKAVLSSPASTSPRVGGGDE